MAKPPKLPEKLTLQEFVALMEDIERVMWRAYGWMEAQESYIREESAIRDLEEALMQLRALRRNGRLPK